MSLKWELVKFLAWISFISTGKCVPLSTFLWITLSILSISAWFDKNFWTKLPMFMRSFNSFGSWKNVFSDLWNVSKITPSWNGEISLKIKLISVLMFSILDELYELSWLLGMFDLIGLGGGLLVGPEWKGTSGIKGLVCVILASTLYIICIASLECAWLVFPVSILVLPGIFCDSSDGWLIVSLMGSDLFLFNPALPWPMHGLNTTFYGIGMLFFGLHVWI